MDGVNSYFLNYRDLISEKEFLKVRQRANNIGEITLFGGDPLNNELTYSVPSEEGNGSYTVKIRVDDLNYIPVEGLRASEINDLIRNSDLHVNCTCPAYLYWGFKYIGSVDDYTLSQEGRYPGIRNPELQGYVCKHIYRALQVYPFSTNTIRQLLVGEV